MIKKTHGKDPFAAREAANYDSPIASREHIQKTITAIGPCKLRKLSQALLIDKDDEQQQEALRRRVGAMLRDHQLIQSASGELSILDEDSLIAGKVVAHKDGYGFLIVDGDSEDLFLSYQEMRKVFDGDEVLVHALALNTKGKKEVEIVKVTKRNTTRVVGKLLDEGKTLRVVPENPRINHTIYIDTNNSLSAEHEELVVVEITQQPEGRQAVKGVIVSVLGKRSDPGIEVAIALQQFAIPYQWPDDVLKQVKSFAKEPTEADKQGRIDLRHLPLVTIDGEDAKDFDDAVYCEKKAGGGWRLWVAIADVSHYVDIHSALDKEAELRATSVYFPDFVVPMLPEALSNGLCSLMPKVDRLSMVCEMTISARGRISGYQFYSAIIRSHARLTYNEVARMLAEKHDAQSLIREQHADVIVPVDELHALYKALRGQRTIRGAVDFETVEVKAVFDEHRKISEIVPVARNDAHKIIEECMLCANVAAARFLESIAVPSLYRVHEGPTEKKLNNLRAFIGELGFSLAGGDKPEPRDYQQLAEDIADRPDAILIQTMMLRSMSQAVYQPDNKGHFGLAYESYAHFTSPIRRYPDLLVHRAIRYGIENGLGIKPAPIEGKKKPVRKAYSYTMERMIQLGEHSSMAERRAEEASRDVLNALKCEYLEQYIGQSFHGVISSVVNFGLFVELDDLYIEGLVHVSELVSDYYSYDGKQRLIGERTRKVYRIGDRVSVIVSRVEISERRIHLQLQEDVKTQSAVSNTPSEKKKSRKKSGKSGKKNK